VSHVSYGLQNIEIKKLTGDLIIRIEQLVTRIPEVRVSGKKIQVLNHKARYSVTDFQFEGPYMWFIGFLDNSPKKGKLFLGNHFGDTICTRPISGNEHLFRDYFGNVHLVTSDSVYQLFAAESKIHLLFGIDKLQFMGLMNAFETDFGPGLAKLEYQPTEDKLTLVYIDSTLNKPKLIDIAADPLQDSSFFENKYGWIGRYFGSRTLQLIINQQKGQYFQSMRSSLFRLADTLFIVNLKDNFLHAFDLSFNEIRRVPISFHLKETKDITNVYLAFSTLIDRVMNRPYIVFHLNNNWRIVPLDPVTGQTLPDLPIPHFNAMHQMIINGNVLYFLYPEKVYPYYERLYRFPIE